MRIIVSGGCGFVGSHLVDSLIKRNDDVLVIDDLSSGNLANLNRQATFVRYDVRNPNAREAVLDFRPEVVFHLAAQPRIQVSFANPVETISNNVVGTTTMLDAAVACGARFVYSGSSTADGNIFLNPYAFAKHAGEELCLLYSRLHDLPTTIARFYNVYGERQIEDGPYSTVIGVWEKQFREGRRLTITGNGSQSRDFTHVSDIVAGLVSMSEINGFRGDVFSLGSGQSHTLNNIASWFGCGVEYIPARNGEARSTLAKLERSSLLLGYCPKVSLVDYITELKQKRAA